MATPAAVPADTAVLMKVMLVNYMWIMYVLWSQYLSAIMSSQLYMLLIRAEACHMQNTVISWCGSKLYISVLINCFKIVIYDRLYALHRTTTN